MDELIQTYSKLSWQGKILVCLAVGGLLFAMFYRLGVWGVLDSSEARYAEIARTMYVSGDYLHPRYLGIEHYHKPPFTYWITAWAYQIFGVTPFAARFFLQWSLLIQLLLVMKMSMLIWAEKSMAWRATLVYLSFLIVWISVRNLSTDAYLNTWLMASFWSLLSYVKRSKFIYLYLTALFAGLGFLTKITAVFVYLGPFVLSLIWSYRRQWRWSWHMLGAVLIFILLAGSWFFFLQMEGKSVLKYVLYDQTVIRYTTDAFKRSMPFYFYFIASIFLAFPWFLLALVSTVKTFRDKSFDSLKGILFIIWFIFPICFFSISSSKLILYILPAFWALAIWTPIFLQRIRNHKLAIWSLLPLVFYFLVLGVLLLFPWWDTSYSTTTPFVAIIITTMILILLVHFRKREELALKMIYMSIVFSVGCVLAVPHFLAVNELQSSTAKPVSTFMKENGLVDRRIFIYDKLVPSLSFHLQKESALVSKNVTRDLSFESTAAWKDHYYDWKDEEDRKRLFMALKNPSVLLVLRRRVDQVDIELVGHYQMSQEIGIWTLFY